MGIGDCLKLEITYSVHKFQKRTMGVSVYPPNIDVVYRHCRHVHVVEIERVGIISPLLLATKELIYFNTAVNRSTVNPV